MPKFSLKNYKLRNGLTVFYVYTPELVSFEISITINTGARDEEKSNNGISHFLEHMMFRGSKKYPDSVSLSRMMESFGGESNAVTGIEHTTYWLKGDACKTEEAIQCFADFFINPVFSDIEIERNIILQEMASDFNENGDTIDIEALSMATLFKGNPLENSVIGKSATVKNIKKCDLVKRKNDFYYPENCILTIYSSLKEEIVFQTLEDSFATYSCFSGKMDFTRKSPVENLSLVNSLLEEKNAIFLQNNPDNQFAIKFMIPLIPSCPEIFILASFLQRVLDDGICTRLPAFLREKHGLVYDVSCDTQFFQDVGTLSIDATVSEENLRSFLQRLSEVLAAFLQDGPTQAEVDHICFRYCFDLKQINESPARLLSREVASSFTGYQFSIDQEIEVVQGITCKNLMYLARKIFCSQRRGFVLVGPRARKKRGYVEEFLSHF